MTKSVLCPASIRSTVRLEIPASHGQLGLRQSRIDSAALQAFADFMQNRLICQLRGDFHNSSVAATLPSKR